MAQKPRNVSNFLRTLADYLDRRDPEIKEFKRIVITAKSGTIGGKPHDFEVRVKGKDISKGVTGDFDLCALHLHVCDWVPCPPPEK
jgi:hypothetical protein